MLSFSLNSMAHLASLDRVCVICFLKEKWWRSRSGGPENRVYSSVKLGLGPRIISRDELLDKYFTDVINWRLHTFVFSNQDCTYLYIWDGEENEEMLPRSGFKSKGGDEKYAFISRNACMRLLVHSKPLSFFRMLKTCNIYRATARWIWIGPQFERSISILYY